MSRTKKYNLNKKMADETLKNVFAACDQSPSNKSFDYIIVKNIANTSMVKMAKWIAAVLLILVMICPLAFRVGSTKQVTARNGVTVVSHELDKEGNRFILRLNGEGIEYSAIYAKTENGNIVVPTDVDEKQGTVVIPFKQGTLNIFVPNEDGTVLQAVLSK